MLALDQAERGSGPIVGLAGISGAFDLRPLLRTSINGDLNLSAEEAESASPLVLLLGVAGGGETGVLKQWPADLAIGWRAHGAPATHIEHAGHSHFTILDA